VIAQTALILAVLVAPKLEERNAFWSGITGAAGGLLCIVGLGFVVLGSIALNSGRLRVPARSKSTLRDAAVGVPGLTTGGAIFFSQFPCR
jgi:hypothetical protein